MVGEHRRLVDQRGQRGAQFVGDVGDESALRIAGALQPSHALFERAGHLVEGGHHPPQFVPRSLVEPGRQVTRCDTGGGIGGRPNRGEHATRQRPDTDAGDGDDHQAGDHLGRQQVAESVFDRRRRVIEVDGRPSGETASDGEIRAPTDVDPLVCELTLGDERRQVGGRGTDEGEARREVAASLQVNEQTIVGTEPNIGQEGAGRDLLCGWIVVEPLRGENPDDEGGLLRRRVDQIRAERAAHQHPGGDPEGDRDEDHHRQDGDDQAGAEAEAGQRAAR